jgi:hypothetical protein
MRSLSSIAHLISLFIIAVSIFLAAPFLQGSRPAAQESMNFSIEGKITQHTGNKLTLNTEGNMVFRVVYNEKSKVARKDGSEGTPKDLVVGTRIHVDGELTEAGEIIAEKINIRSEPAAEKR